MIVRLLLSFVLAALLMPAATYADECSREGIEDVSVGPLVAAAGDHALALRQRAVLDSERGASSSDLRVVALGPGSTARVVPVSRAPWSVGAALGSDATGAVATWWAGTAPSGERRMLLEPADGPRATLPPLAESTPFSGEGLELGASTTLLGRSADGTIVLLRLLAAPEPDDEDADEPAAPPLSAELVRIPADGLAPTHVPLAASGPEGMTLAVDRGGRAWATVRSGGRSQLVRWDPDAAAPVTVPLAGSATALAADDHGAWAVTRRSNALRLLRLRPDGPSAPTPLPGARDAQVAVGPSGVGVLVSDVASGRRGDGGDVRLRRVTTAGLERRSRVIARSRQQETFTDLQLARDGRPYVLIQRNGRRPWERDLVLWRGGRTIPVAARGGRVDERNGALAVLEDGSAWIVHDRSLRTSRRHPVCGYFDSGRRWEAVRVSPAGRVATRRVLPGARPLGSEYGG